MKFRFGFGPNRFGFGLNRFGFGLNRFGFGLNRFGFEPNRFGFEPNRFNWNSLLTVRSFFRAFLRRAKVLENLGFSKRASLLNQMLCPESGDSAPTLLLGSSSFPI